jgi:hypothetical protein
MVCSTHKQTLQHFNSYLVNQALESGLTWIELRTASVFVKRGRQAENCACRLRCSGSVSRCLFFPLLVFGSVYFPFSFRRNEGWLGLWKLLKHRPMSRNCFCFWLPLAPLRFELQTAVRLAVLLYAVLVFRPGADAYRICSSTPSLSLSAVIFDCTPSLPSTVANLALRTGWLCALLRRAVTRAMLWGVTSPAHEPSLIQLSTLSLQITSWVPYHDQTCKNCMPPRPLVANLWLALHDPVSSVQWVSQWSCFSHNLVLLYSSRV